MCRSIVFGTSLSVTSLVGAAALAMSEEAVTLLNEGQPFVGTLATPDGAPAPVVLMLHGFSGSRDELKTDAVPEGVFARTARALADAGMASLRIDFRGSGDSIDDLSFAETTFEGQVADALAALDWLKASDRVKSDDIYLIGWSQGGLVATAVAGRTGVPDAVALWAAVADPEMAFATLIDAETMARGKAAAADEPVTITLPWAEFTLNGAFFDGVESFDPQAEIAAYSGPLFVAQGSEDTTVLPENADLLIAAHDGPERLWTAEMDHVFNSFTTSDTLDEMLVQTIGFFREHDD